jgi:7-keto-8-aminopelargonate synthetase-like enzyme
VCVCVCAWASAEEGTRVLMCVVSGADRGTDEYHNVRGRIDIINSTLGKALGGASGTASSP